MTTKNNQPASVIPNDDLTIAPGINPAKIVPLNIRYDVVPQQSPIKVK